MKGANDKLAVHVESGMTLRNEPLFKERIAAARKALGAEKAAAVLKALESENCGHPPIMKQQVRALEDAVKASNTARPTAKPAMPAPAAKSPSKLVAEYDELI